MEPAIILVILSTLAFVLSLTMLCLLLSIKYKDFAIYLKIELFIYDMLLEISSIIYCYFVPSLSSEFTYIHALNETQMLYSRFIHSTQIVIMAWALYKAVTQKFFVSNKGIFRFTIFTNATALGITLTYLTLLNVYPNSYGLIFIVFYFGFLGIPSIIIGCLLIWFYYHIRKTLKHEYLLTIPIAKQKRAIAKQLIFFPIAYFVMIGCYISGLLSYFFVESEIAYIAVDVIFCLYPMMNSIAYGISNSTKRFMSAICLRDEEYDEIEETENVLRNENLLAPRIYFDFFNYK
jgi:hypothetical protein